MNKPDYRYTYAALIEAFTIFAKYGDGHYNLSAEHDALYAGPNVSEVSEEDKARLEAIGWLIEDDTDSFFHFT